MLVEDTIRKILDILKELPPDASFAASVMLKMNLPGPPIGGLAGVMMINGALAPSPSTTFPVSEPKEWDIISPPFPFKSRFG